MINSSTIFKKQLSIAETNWNEYDSNKKWWVVWMKQMHCCLWLCHGYAPPPPKIILYSFHIILFSFPGTVTERWLNLAAILTLKTGRFGSILRLILYKIRRFCLNETPKKSHFLFWSLQSWQNIQNFITWLTEGRKKKKVSSRLIKSVRKS